MKNQLRFFRYDNKNAEGINKMKWKYILSRFGKCVHTYKNPDKFKEYTYAVYFQICSAEKLSLIYKEEKIYIYINVKVKGLSTVSTPLEKRETLSIYMWFYTYYVSYIPCYFIKLFEIR